MALLFHGSLQERQESHDCEVDGGDIGVVCFTPFFEALIVP